MDASPQTTQNHGRMRAQDTEWVKRRATIGLLAPDIQQTLLTGPAAVHVALDWVLAQVSQSAASIIAPVMPAFSPHRGSKTRWRGVPGR